MGSDEDHTTVYDEENLDEDDDDKSEDENLTLQDQNEDDDLVDEEEEDDSISSAADEVTIAVAGIPNGEPTEATGATATTITRTTPITPLPRSDVIAVVEEKKPMFQRLWTAEDEIELLQGFLDYSSQRGTNNSSHHHDTAAFYDQIKSKLQLDFNKNQLVEKLRRLKKKYRNVLGKISSGKEYVFKSPHDQATFDISCKIWGTAGSSATTAVADIGGFDDEEAHNPNPNASFNLNDHNSNGLADPNSSEKKVSRPRKRTRSGAVKIEERFNQQPQQQPQCDQAVGVGAPNSSIPSLVEETVKSCFLPLFKELLNSSVNGPCGSRGFGMNLNPPTLCFGGRMSYPVGDMTDDKWRKQHILELEVYSKRLELMQDQIKSQLEELRSMGVD